MQHLGKFEVIERLGSGGMGVVYRARDTELGRQVALKVLPGEVNLIASRRQRFLQEARAIAALNHPSIATLYEFGEASDENGDERLFLAMELVEGEDLYSLLGSGPLPLRRALGIARDLADGLEAAHQRGIIHRDLKPSNVRITRDGKVKILDFGLAKAAAPTTPDLPEDVPVTREGVPMGTPPYLAPEQARGETVDGRADLFSLGVLLFEMLSGRPPYRARSFSDYVVELEHGPARSLRDELPDAPPRLVALVARLLHRKRGSRLSTALEVREQLQEMLEQTAGVTSADTSVATEPFLGSPHRESSRALAMMGLTVLLLALPVLVVLGWRAWRAATSNDGAPHRLAVIPFDNLTGDATLEYQARGLSAALSGELSSLPEISVLSPSVTAAYSGADDRHQRMAEEQGVDAIFEGRIQRERSVLRVAVDYVEAASGRLLWSLAFEDSDDAVLRLQAAVAAGVGDRLRGILSPDSVVRLEREPTSSNEAFENHLRGLQFLEQFHNQADLEVAIHYFERAIELDPGFASAHAQLANALLLHAERSHDVDRIERGIRLARTALELDPGLVAAKLALANGLRQSGRVDEAASLLEGIESADTDEERLAPGSQLALLLERAANERASGRSEAATRLHLQAIEIAPGSWQAWHALGVDSMQSGRLNDAREQLERARELAPIQVKPLSNLVALELLEVDPRGAVDLVSSFHAPITDASLASNAGTAYYMLGSLDLAEDYYRLARQLRPTDEVLLGNLGDVLLKLGRGGEAKLEYEAALALVAERAEVFPNAPGIEAAEVLYLAKAGRCTEASAADRDRRLTVRESRELLRLAKGAALCARPQDALGYLERALEAGLSRGELRSADELASLRELPEYRRLAGTPPPSGL